MSFRYFVILLLLSKTCTCLAQLKAANGKAIHSVDLDSFIVQQMRNKQVPGLSFALINKGNIVYSKAYGVQDLASQTPVTSHTIFEAASISKSVFAYFTMLQVQKRLLDLDTPLYHYFPTPLLEEDDRYQQITTRMVLSHTSGLPNWRFFNEDGKLDLKHEPGSTFHYSGEGYEYLARVLAHLHQTDAAGLEKIIQEELCEPLGLSNSGFRLPAKQLHTQKAKGYEAGEPSEGIPADLAAPYFGASFNFHTTANDFAQFMQALFRPKLLRCKLQKILFAEAVQLPADESLRTENGFEAWGLGFMRATTPYGVKLAHGGMNPSFQGYFMILRKQRFGFVFFGNSDTAIELVEDLELFLLEGSFDKD